MSGYCRCILTWRKPEKLLDGTAFCDEIVVDRPFCDTCEPRHPAEAADGVIVSALPLDVPHPRERPLLQEEKP